MAINHRAPYLQTIRIAVIAVSCAFVASCQNSTSPVSPGPQAKFYEVFGADYWGDYGSVLIQGYAEIHDKTDGSIEVKRTGPFAPPITFPLGPDGFELVATDKFRNELQAAGLGRFGFRKVVKVHIVDIPWQDWDLNADYPPSPTDLGDPDKYLDRPHSPQAADAMGDLWQVILDARTVDDASNEGKQPQSSNQNRNGDDIFRYDSPTVSSSGNFRPIVVTARGKQWLEGRVGKWVRFREIPVK